MSGIDSEGSGERPPRAEDLPGGLDLADKELPETTAKAGDAVPVEMKGQPVYSGGKIIDPRGDAGDGSRRKEVRAEVQTRGLYLESVLNSTPEGIVTLDASHRILEWNSKAEQIFGYTREEAVGKDLDELVANPEAVKAAKWLTMQVMSGTEVPPIEGIRYRKGGTAVEVIVAASPIRIDGRVEGLVAVFSDISERKRFEQRLQPLTRAVEQSGEGVVILDLEGGIIFCNRTFANMHGYSPQEVVGKHFFIFHTPEQIPAVLEAKERALREGNFVDEIWHSRRDGTPFLGWTDCTLFRDREDNPIGIIASLRDLTDLGRVQEALWKSEERFRKFAYEAAFEGIIIHDKGKILDVNQQFARMYGYERHELIGMSVLGTVAAERREGFRKNLLEENEKAYESVGLRKDGATFPIEIRARLIPYGEKTVRMGAVRDISERKQAEKALREYQAELERQVEARTADLIRAKEALVQELRERRRIAEQVLLHQKRLGSLASQLSLAEERERRHMASDLHDNIGHALALARIKLDGVRQSNSLPLLSDALNEIKEILKSAMDGVRSLTFDLSPPVLHELGFEEAVDWLVERFNGRSDILYRFKEKGRIGPLREDLRIILFQALRELMINTAKHSRASNAAISLGFNEEEDIVIVVEDDGIGFTIGEESDRSGDREGFGLFNIRERFESIGGEVHIESSPGRGSTITLVAPLRGSEEPGKESRDDH